MKENGAKVLEMDNKFDYEKNVRISATEQGYEVIDAPPKMKALENVDLEPIEVIVTDNLQTKQKEGELPLW